MNSRHLMAGLLAAALAGQAAMAADSAGGKLGPDSIATLWEKGDPGQRLSIRGRILGRDRSPVSGATVRIRQADATGQYHGDRYNGSVRTTADGRYQINTVLPGQEYGAKHIHLAIEHEAHMPVYTEIVFKGDPSLSPHQVDEAIALEEARFKDETILFGDHETVLEPSGGR